MSSVRTIKYSEVTEHRVQSGPATVVYTSHPWYTRQTCYQAALLQVAFQSCSTCSEQFVMNYVDFVITIHVSLYLYRLLFSAGGLTEAAVLFTTSF
jgi:hypothetical protein